MPRVYNISEGFPENAVLVDRTTEFGNPFVIGRDGTRQECIDKYIKYIDNNQELKKKIKDELEGKDLVCHCAPKACHANYILHIANSNLLF